jgi:hypothetical protein
MLAHFKQAQRICNAQNAAHGGVARAFSVCYQADEPRKENIKNVTIRQQIGLVETTVKETEQNQLTWYGNVQKMVERRLPKTALKWMPKQKRARGRPKKNWMEGIRKAMNEGNLNEGQCEDRKQWSLGVGQRRKAF